MKKEQGSDGRVASTKIGIFWLLNFVHCIHTYIHVDALCILVYSQHVQKCL